MLLGRSHHQTARLPMTSAVELRRHRMAVAACLAFQRETSSSVLVTTEMGYAKDFRSCPDTRLSPGGSARLKGCREQTLRFPKNEREVGFPYRGRRGDNCRVGLSRIHCADCQDRRSLQQAIRHKGSRVTSHSSSAVMSS
jgi:hypothetical protein